MGRLTNKQKREKREAKAEQARINKARLLDYLKNYGEPDLIQSASASVFDPQIKQLAGVITTELSHASHGTIIDIGCGEGILLDRLLKITAFKDVDECLYVGTDHHPQIEKTLKIAFDAGIHRRVELINLPDFYKEWPSQDRLTKPYIVVVRNVLHELDIQQTSVLLHHIASNLSKNDVLIIQDLQVFPVGERGNACWAPTDLEQVLAFCGFSAAVLNEPSSSGNHWFSIISRKTTDNAKNYDEVHRAVLKNREKQYCSWLELGWLVPDDDSFREVVLAKIDFDLQCASLNLQLVREGSKGVARTTKKQQGEIAKKTFTKQLMNFSWKDVRGINEEILHTHPFRDRAHYLDKIEEFLLSDSSVLVVRGGPSSGKTVLVKQALFRRTYNKEAVFVDIGRIPNVWSIIEQVLSGVRCNFTPALLTSLASIQFADIKNEFEQFFHNISHRVVVSFDHFESILDDDGSILDDEVNKLINLLIEAPNSKIIFTTRREPGGAIFPSEKCFGTDLPPVGRFPKGKHVENLLNDYVNKGELGLTEYPPKLFDAIDRHPYLTVLAGLVIRKRGGHSLKDESFLEEIRLDLRANLLSKLTDETIAPLIEILSLMRRPVPRATLESLTNSKTVRAAEEAGLIYPSPYPDYPDLMAQLGVFRTTPPDIEDMYSDQALSDVQETNATDTAHLRIAMEYEVLYRSTSDPVWLREIHFHKLAAGNIKDAGEFGAAYSSEIFWAGNYWFDIKKDYSSALWAFEAARRLGIKTVFTEMRRASCLIRLGKHGGEEIYDGLIARYPYKRGLKLSYISSLLYVKRFSAALRKLKSFHFTINEDPWVANEYGRAYLGLHNYKDAKEAFKVQLKHEHDPKAFMFDSLARAYQRLGDSDGVDSTLIKGVAKFPDNYRLNLRYASHLIRLGDAESRKRAESILANLFSTHHFDGAVLQQYCKLLCLTGRINDAEKLWNDSRFHIRPAEYGLAIQVGISISKGEWSDALDVLKDIPSDNEHLVGMKKAIFLAWATAIDGDINKKLIAKQGLDIGVASTLKDNIPILITSAKLALIAEENTIFDQYVDQVAGINKEIADMLVAKADDLTYLEDDIGLF